MPKWKRLVGIAAGIFVASYPASWLYATNSEAYSNAVQYLRGNAFVRDRLGALTDIGLKPFGYSIRYSGAQGAASFELTLRGSKGAGTGYIELEKRGVWDVTYARLVGPGTSVTQLVGK